MEFSSRRSCNEMIKPSTPCPPGTTFNLTNLDQAAPRIFVPMLLFFPAFPDSDHLKLSLSKTLSILYPLAGRLVLLPNGYLGVRCSDEGVEFIEKCATTSMKEEFDFRRYNPKARLLVSGKLFAEEQDPLVFIQVTRFTCGGASLSVEIHHSVVDGMGMTMFINTWAKISAGKQGLLRAPCFDGDQLNQTSATAAAAAGGLRTPFGFQVRNVPSTPLSEDEVQEARVEMFTFTKGQILKLREQLLFPGASRFEILCGHIWFSVTKARALDPKQEITFGFMVDVRKISIPALPDEYFGNACLPAYAVTTVEQLLEGGAAYAVSLIQEAKRKLNNEHLRYVVDWIEQVGIRNVWLKEHQPADVMTTSWFHFRLYEADFGCGPPCFTGAAGIYMGGVVIMPWNSSSKLDECVRVIIGLNNIEMKNLVSDLDFMPDEMNS